MNKKKSETNQEQEKCCYPNCNSLAEPLSNYCQVHKASNYQFHEKRIEMRTRPFSLNEIMEDLTNEEIERLKNPFTDINE